MPYLILIFGLPIEIPLERIFDPPPSISYLGYPGACPSRGLKQPAVRAGTSTLILPSMFDCSSRRIRTRRSACRI